MTEIERQAIKAKASTDNKQLKALLDGIIESEQRFAKREREINRLKLSKALQTGQRGIVVDFQTLAIIKH